MQIMAETNGPRELNLQMHRAPVSVWDRRGWNGTREEIAITRLLLGIGGAALAVQGIRLGTWTGRALAGVGGTVAWWALTGEGDLSQARQWFTRVVGGAREGPADADRRRVGGVVPGERCALVDPHRRHGAAPCSGKPLMLRALRVPVGWREIFRRTGSEVIADNCLGLAAQLAYYFFLALFPALLFLLALISFIPIEDLLEAITTTLARVAPGEVLSLIQEQIVKIAQDKDGGLLTLGMIGTIWSTSAGMTAIIDTLNQAYDIHEGRPWWKVRLVAIGLTVALAVFIVGSTVLVVAGPAIADRVADWLHLGAAFAWTWTVVQWPLVFGIVTLGIAIIYYYAPDAEQDWIWITPGSVLATLLWLLISLGFRFYVDELRRVYGIVWRGRRRDYRDAVVLPVGPGHPRRGGTERRNRARLAVRQGSRRKSAGREEEDRVPRRTRLAGSEGARHLPSGVRQRQLRPRQRSAADCHRPAPAACQRLDSGRHSRRRRRRAPRRADLYGSAVAGRRP